MNIENNDTGTLTEQEGEDLFRQAYSQIHGEAPEPAVEAPVENEIEDAVTETPEPVQEEQKPDAQQEPTNPDPSDKKQDASAGPTIEDMLSGIPEEKQKFVKQLLAERDLADQRFKSHQGRLAAERRQRQAVEQELLKLRTRGPSSPQDPALAEQSKADFAKALEEWKLVVEAEPTLAKAVDALTDAKVGQVERKLNESLHLQEQREALQKQHAFEEAKQREWEIVVQHVPNVADVASSPEFKEWKENVAPPALRHLADTAIDHRDVLFVLQQYTPYAMWVNEQRNGAAPAKPTDSAVADKISEQRQNKSSPVISGAPLRQNVAPDVGNTFDDATAERLFLEAYKKVKSR